MHKLVFFVLMVIVWWMLHALQIDEEAALGTLHEGKRAIDRAAQAAAQQTDRDKLEAGVLSIDEEKALDKLEEAAESLAPRQQRRIAAAAEAWLATYPQDDSVRDMRFDAILVAPGKVPRHIKGAFETS